MLNFKEKVVELISNQVESLDKGEIASLIEIPPSYDMGGLCFSSF